MFKLDDTFLTDLGFGDMPSDERKAFLLHIYDELQVRVGDELSKSLSDQQLDEFEDIIKETDETKAVAWLEQNCPGYKDTVASVMENLKQELVENKDRLLGTQDAYELAS